MSEITNDHSIRTYFHCARCMREKPEDVSMRDFAKFEIGWTEIGLQAWCTRHGVNIVHVNFEGQRHPANTTARGITKAPTVN